MTYVYKSAINGEFVTAEYALANPNTTYRLDLTRRKGRKKKGGK